MGLSVADRVSSTLTRSTIFLARLTWGHGRSCRVDVGETPYLGLIVEKKPQPSHGIANVKGQRHFDEHGYDLPPYM